jgi:3-methyladenine DNA glycosylase/8-oxoguanine DNA glycosylase
VLPVTDYGVRKGFALTFQKIPKTRALAAADLPKADVMLKRAKKWAPFAAWRAGICGGRAIWQRQAPAGRSEQWE